MDKIDSYFIINATRNIATMGVEEFKDIAPYFLF